MTVKSKKICAVALILGLSMTSVGNTEEVQAATKVKLNKTKLTLQVGKTYKLKLKNLKKSKKVKWSSSKKKVATVSQKGKVTAKKAGTAKITAKVGKKKYNCKVIVKLKIKNKNEPTASSDSKPTPEPTASSDSKPTSEPTASPDSKPTLEPTASADSKPTPEPTASPDSKPTPEPTASPSTESIQDSEVKPTEPPLDPSQEDSEEDLSDNSNEDEEGCHVSGYVSGISGKYKSICFYQNGNDYSLANIIETNEEGRYYYEIILKSGTYSVHYAGEKLGEVSIEDGEEEKQPENFMSVESAMYGISGQILYNGAPFSHEKIVLICSEPFIREYRYAEIETDENGNYEFPPLAAGGYLVYFPQLYKSYRITVSDENVRKDISLRLVTGKITGVRGTAKNRMYFINSNAMIVNEDDSYYTADQDGNCEFSIVLEAQEHKVKFNDIYIGTIEEGESEITERNIACYESYKLSGEIKIDGELAQNQEMVIAGRRADHVGDEADFMVYYTTSHDGKYELYLPADMGSGYRTVPVIGWPWSFDDFETQSFTIEEDMIKDFNFISLK